MPFSTLEATVSKLDQFQNDYSNEAADLIYDVKEFMNQGLYAYAMSADEISDWCKSATPHLEGYISLFDDPSKFGEQKALLIKVLDEGIQSMNTAQELLSRCSSRYKIVQFTKLLLL